jgi:hypothetical protein
MTARALLLLAALFAAGPARAEAPESVYERLKSAAEPEDRIRACAELSSASYRAPRAYQALAAAMDRDLSERVRQAAAVAALAYPGGQTLALIDAFLKAEPGAAVRSAVLVALSTEAAHFENPDATRIIAYSLAEDPSPEVRLAAAAALGARGDVLALGAVGRASERDGNPGVRAAARRAMIGLSRPPKPKPKPQLHDPPKPDAVFGKDPCPRPWGWCACSGAIKLKPKCLTRDECRSLQSEMRRHDLTCGWDSLGRD